MRHCCQRMAEQVDVPCAVHGDAAHCPDRLVVWNERFNEYGLPVRDGGSSSVLIHFCPWCGQALPASLRGRWFAELAALGVDDPWGDDIPEAYKTGAWHRSG